MGFRNDFIWGAATAAYQIEGAAAKDGKGLCIWDTFSHKKGKTYQGHTGDIACDHYTRYEEDVALMVQMGIKSYRFSINWARVLPDGIGASNRKGIKFYNRLIDKLLENNIRPFITLYHWELPQTLYEKGGWQNAESPKWFAEYAKLVVENFSDRVTDFITFNEPQCVVGLGHRCGKHAPGLMQENKELLNIGVNILKAHGLAVKTMREFAKQPLNIGITMACAPPMPASDSPMDLQVAKLVYDNPLLDRFEFSDAFWLDPIVLGKFPQSILDKAAKIMPAYTEDDLKLINQPIDFIGHNVYRGEKFKADKDGMPVYIEPVVGNPRTAIGWDITYDAMYWSAKLCCDKYKLPYYITENGMSAHDVVSLDGEVHDPNRIDYMHRYLLGLKKANDEGYDIRGYFAWSLMDNFEWSYGYSERFGMVFVDYQTQKRIMKDSGKWYRTVIESNGENL